MPQSHPLIGPRREWEGNCCLSGFGGGEGVEGSGAREGSCPPGEGKQWGQGVWRCWAWRWRAHGGGLPGGDWCIAFVGGILIDPVKVDGVLDLGPEVFEVSPEVAHVVWGGGGIVVGLSKHVSDRAPVGHEEVFLVHIDGWLAISKANDSSFNVQRGHGVGGDGFDSEKGGKSGVCNAVASQKCSNTSNFVYAKNF